MEDIMKILSADTSSPRFSIALLENNKTIDQYEPKDLNMHSSDLLPAIDKLLSKSSYKIKNIDAFCVGIGPGSFTGLRIGVTTMRALALALEKPIVGVSSIDAIAYNLTGEISRISVIIDAKQSKVYSRFYRHKNKQIMPEAKVRLLSIEELLKKIKTPITFLGDGLKVYKDNIISIGLEGISFALESDWYPKAANIGMLGYEKLRLKKKDNVLKLSPLYIYPKECQIKKR